MESYTCFHKATEARERVGRSESMQGGLKRAQNEVWKQTLSHNRTHKMLEMIGLMRHLPRISEAGSWLDSDESFMCYYRN